MRNLIVLFLLLLTMFTHAQNILRVNNTAGINVPYTTIAAAVTAAGVNDIIQVEGSITSYGAVTLTKKVTLVGPGYYTDQNTGLQASTLTASVSTLTFNAGSSGSSVSGMVMTGNVSINSVSDINLSYNACAAQINFSGNGSNIFIHANYSGDLFTPSAGNYSNVFITNNYLIRINTGSTSTYTVLNNIINSSSPSDFKNADIRNNIFTSTNGFTLTNCTFKNNVSVVPAVGGTDPVNVWSVAYSSLFIGLTGNTSDTQWKLKALSPAIGAGEGGIDCGIYGGSSPYKPSGIVAGRHTITNLSAPGTVIQNGTLNVKVSGKVN
jgi:hypothetical protein